MGTTIKKLWDCNSMKIVFSRKLTVFEEPGRKRLAAKRHP
jgi:hypothetical protein